VWQMPELALSIMKNLERERLDLIQLSLVSKSMRNLALRALVRNLDIPLSKIAKVGYLLEQNADLAAEIQHVRLWDDEAHRINRWRGVISAGKAASEQGQHHLFRESPSLGQVSQQEVVRNGKRVK